MRTMSGSGTVFFVSVVSLIMLALTPPTGGMAEDAKGLLSDVNKVLRQAEKDMFDGKTDNAIAALPALKEKLLKAKALDTDNPGLKSTEQKYQKLVKDLERRTGKDLGGGTLTAASTSSKTALPAMPEVKPLPEKPTPAAPPLGVQTDSPPQKAAEVEQKSASATQQPALTVSAPKTSKAENLPYHARGPIETAKKNLARIDEHVQKMSDPQGNKKQLLGQMDELLESARQNFEAGKAKAAEKGVTENPDFAEIEKGIPAAAQKIAEAKKGHAEAAAAAAAGTEEVTVDVKALMDEYNKHKNLFDQASGTAIYYNELPPLKELLAQIEDFEKNRMAGVKSKLDAFAGKYGTTEDEIDRKAEAMGYADPYYRASFAFLELGKGIENISKTRSATADDLIRSASEMKERASQGIHDFFRTQQHERIKAWGQVAAQFDPESRAVKEFIGGLDAWITADMNALNAKIDKATFPKQAADAPEGAGNLTNVIREFLQKEEDDRAAQGKEAGKVAAVVVTGPWRIFKKNLLGEPIQYNLPITTAIQIENEKRLSLTRVYHGTMLTQEFTGVKMEPPFICATVGESYYIRPSALK